jgi:ubiquinone/menaquinone biosynthesis C-methylase UbiE
MSNLGAPEQLQDTRAAFDSVAAVYDGPRGNNELIQDMRTEMWHVLDTAFPVPARLLDLGCGTGLDAVRMAAKGHRVTATDWSSGMTAQTGTRAQEAGLSDRVQALTIGAHELDRIATAQAYDGAYSNLGPLNCVPDLGSVARECARLLKPGGAMVFSVIGRICPWEVVHYSLRGRWSRLAVRYHRGAVPVTMNGRTIWTRYYTPREFYRPFAQHFELRHFRALCLFVPPPYISWVRDRHRRWYDALWRLDRRTSGWPLLRGLGDHFLLIMTRR